MRVSRGNGLGAARQSFGDFARVKSECCEIRRRLPINRTVWKMGMYISIAVVAGATALWAVNMPHHNFSGVLWQLVAIVVLARSFVVGRRAISIRQLWGVGGRDFFVTEVEAGRKDKNLLSDECEAHNVEIAAHDEQGRTPVERMID